MFLVVNLQQHAQLWIRVLNFPTILQTISYKLSFSDTKKCIWRITFWEYADKNLGRYHFFWCHDISWIGYWLASYRFWTRKNYLSLCIKIQFDEEKWSREIFWTIRGAAKKITVKTTHFVSAKIGVWTSKKCFFRLIGDGVKIWMFLVIQFFFVEKHLKLVWS